MSFHAGIVFVLISGFLIYLLIYRAASSILINLLLYLSPITVIISKNNLIQDAFATTTRRIAP